MDISKNSTFLLICFFFVSVFAAKSDWVSFQKELLDFYHEIDTYQTDFIQKNYWAGASVSKSSEGTLYYTNQKLLLKYKKPDEQVMLVDSTQVQLFNPISNQLLITSSIDVPLRPAEIIEQYVHEADEIEMETRKDTILISTSTIDYQKVTMLFKNKLLIGFSLQDHENNQVSYEFNNIQYNQPLDSSLFKLSLPEKVQIIDRREK